jgi:hypothetical protein
MLLRVGDRVWVGGGYYEPVQWVRGRGRVTGTVKKWIPGQNTEPACVVVLDEPLEIWDPQRGSVTGEFGHFLVLELRYAGQTWEDEGTVHVEVCRSEPESVSYWDRVCGTWVESHATYSKA